ncbi:MAG: DUF2993 domain-containing protein [Pseudonocardia sp.]|nr:DUF2993 domain-containing protein [Pseudonocardia sp.]
MRKFLAFVVILALAGVAGDRVAHRLATDSAESRLAAKGLTGTQVEVSGFPFLDQALRRRFDEVRVDARSLRTDRGSASNVRIVARDVRGPSLGQVTIGGLSGRGTVTYAEVVRRVDQPGLTLLSLRDAGDGRVELRRKVTVLGRTATATAVGRVQARGQRLRVTATSVEITGGSSVDDPRAQSLSDLFSFTYRLRGLPEGVVIRSIDPAGDGFVVRLAGADVSVVVE